MCVNKSCGQIFGQNRAKLGETSGRKEYCACLLPNVCAFLFKVVGCNIPLPLFSKLPGEFLTALAGKRRQKQEKRTLRVLRSESLNNVIQIMHANRDNIDFCVCGTFECFIWYKAAVEQLVLCSDDITLCVLAIHVKLQCKMYTLIQPVYI